VFVMTLSYSRHQYAELVYDQTVATWLTCHRRAFEFFGGVPERVVLDNLGTAIVRACREDPRVQQSYRECAEHYGFLIDPNPVATPRMKGKVEKGGVHYVKRNFLAGRELERTDTLNVKLLKWCTQTAGLRVHGTTRGQLLACRRALHFGDDLGSTVRRILEQGLEDAPLVLEASTPKTDKPRIYLFARHAHELAASLLAVGGWR
jgi:hypothetical protein